MGFAASSTASEQTSADDLASLVSAIATTRQAASFSDAQGVQGLQGALLADSVVSTCRSEDTQLIKVGVADVLGHAPPLMEDRSHSHASHAMHIMRHEILRWHRGSCLRLLQKMSQQVQPDHTLIMSAAMSIEGPWRALCI